LTFSLTFTFKDQPLFQYRRRAQIGASRRIKTGGTAPGVILIVGPFWAIFGSVNVLVASLKGAENPSAGEGDWL
jgi:hypothetical protein